MTERIRIGTVMHDRPNPQIWIDGLPLFGVENWDNEDERISKFSTLLSELLTERDALRAALLQERERCAKCRDDMPAYTGKMPNELLQAAAQIIHRAALDKYEAAIRALGPAQPVAQIDTNTPSEAIESAVEFLREIVQRQPTVLYNHDVEAFILNVLNPALVVARKFHRHIQSMQKVVERSEPVAQAEPVAVVGTQEPIVLADGSIRGLW